MPKYHISPETGNPNQCTAKPGNCRYGADTEHHSSKEAARDAYEKAQSEATVSTVARASKTFKEKISDFRKNEFSATVGDDSEYIGLSSYIYGTDVSFGENMDINGSTTLDNDSARKFGRLLKEERKSVQKDDKEVFDVARVGNTAEYRRLAFDETVGDDNSYIGINYNRDNGVDLAIMEETSMQSITSFSRERTNEISDAIDKTVPLKYSTKIMEMDEFVDKITGINVLTRNKMRRAFESDNAGSELDKLINHGRDNHIDPDVKETLNAYWKENFNESSRYKG